MLFKLRHLVAALCVMLVMTAGHLHHPPIADPAAALAMAGRTDSSAPADTSDEAAAAPIGVEREHPGDFPLVMPQSPAPGHMTLRSEGLGPSAEPATDEHAAGTPKRPPRRA